MSSKENVCLETPKRAWGDMVTWKANLFENMLKVIASAGMFLVIDSLSLSLTCQQTGFSHLAEGEENADCRKTRASCKETQKMLRVALKEHKRGTYLLGTNKP